MATTVITNYQAIASTIATMGGTSGLQFRATATHLQWKTADTEWADLVSLAEIGGTDFSLIEWGVSATHLQWRFDGVNWVDVIALSALGVTDDITSLTPEAGKIPLAGEDGKIASEWVRDVVTATTSPGGGSRILHNLVSDVLPRPSGFDWTPPISVICNRPMPCSMAICCWPPIRPQAIPICCSPTLPATVCLRRLVPCLWPRCSTA